MRTTLSVINHLFYRLRHLGLALVVLLLSSTAWARSSLLDHYHRLLNGNDTTLPGTHISLASSEQDDVLSAEVNSILHTPFETVAAAMVRASNWCQVMPLHFNIKACTYETRDGVELLTIYSGRKIYEAPDDSYPISYRFEIVRHDDAQLSLRLRADAGPVSTRDYLIELDAMPVAEGTLLHIHSSYRTSWLSSMLTSTYLSTIGRDKVGFSRIEQDGELIPVQGIKGIIERNVMRYHLAINAFLGALSLPEVDRHEATLANWFEQNENYPPLHEMDEAEYLQIKHREWDNQQQLQQALNDRLHLAVAP
jgi:hypothetical protein